MDEITQKLLDADVFVELIKSAEDEDLINLIRAASEELYYREKVGE